MFNIGPGELVAILAVALIVLGPNRLPEAVRTVGRVVGELRRISSGFQEELRNAFDDADVIDQLETKPANQADPANPANPEEPDDPAANPDDSAVPLKPTTDAIDTAAIGLGGTVASTEPPDGSEHQDDVVDDLDDVDDLDQVDHLDADEPHTDDPPDTDQRAAS